MKALKILLLLLLLCGVILAACNPAQTQEVLTALTVIPQTGAESWQYVVFGDSTTWGYPWLYAHIMEQDLGIKIEVVSWTQGGDRSNLLLERLQENAEFRQDIKDAEVISFVIPWGVFAEPITTYMSNPEECGGYDHQDCLREALATYQSDTEMIVEEIISLHAPSEALIRTHDTWQFNTTIYKEAGEFEVINGYFQAANVHMIKVCEGHSIPVARVYDEFMGVDNDLNPEDTGLIYDGFHTTMKGQEIITQLLLDLGYAYAREKE